MPRENPRGGGILRFLRYMNQRYWIGRRVTRWLLRLGRRVVPIFRFPIGGKITYVLRWDDVRDVLERPKDFSVAIFNERMTATTGPFFLGMDPCPRYFRESGAMARALGVPDPRPGAKPGARSSGGALSWVRSFASRLSRTQVEQALKDKGEIDVVQDLANVVPYRFACEFFGVSEPDPDKPSLQRWLQIISYFVFSAAATHWAVPAARAGGQIRAHLKKLIADQRRASSAPDNVLGRLLDDKSIDDDAIARSLAGTLSGTIIPTSWLFIEAVDRLLRLPPAEFQELHKRASEGDASGVRDFVIEAARYFPFPFYILRYAEHDTKIRGKTIAEGTHVALVIGSAVADPRAVPHPERFVVGRPESQYMLFGHETHFCQGKDVAEAILTEMALALFSQENLRRAPGLRGFIANGPKGRIPEGAYPASLILKAGS